MTVSAVWTIADIVNGLMAIPNLIALVALNGVVVAEVNAYFKKLNTTPSIESPSIVESIDE